ncbi:MAG: DHHA1 domain-containing protein, partial [Porticoccaceae bacterium]|nr:DHHA1 domain-containing protein [Porticoccaceae bacterium]
DNIRLEGATEFCGYSDLELLSTVVGLYRDGNAVDSVGNDDEIAMILDKTVFYAESGGQVGDTGVIISGSATLLVSDCRKVGDHHVHIGKVVGGTFGLGDQVDGRVDKAQRHATTLNHSATHLLHEALRQVLGEHVHQKGSLVNDDRLRFDFSHNDAVSSEDIRKIEHIVNQQVLKNIEVTTELMNMEQAKEKGAMALFGEKYGDRVRVVSIGGEFSVELCGGTHVSRTGDIGLVKISTESSVAAGVRRIESFTGMKAVTFCDQQQDSVSNIASIVKANRAGIDEKVQGIVEENRRLLKDIEKLKAKLANAAGSDLMAGAREIKGISVLATVVEGADAKSLRGVGDQVRSKIQSGVFLLAAVDGDKAALVAGVTKDLTDKIKAGDVLQFVTSKIGGKGGGRPDMAQGATSNLTELPTALASVYSWIEENLV